MLNLFAYTGSASVHAAIGGATSVTTVDMSNTYLDWAKRNFTVNGLTGKQYQFEQADCLQWLSRCRNQFDLIFADPPYDLNRIPEIAPLVFEQNLLKPNGILIIEHQSMQDLSNHPNFKEKRTYGYTAFSFFNKNQ